jgi:hypothetical protein
LADDPGLDETLLHPQLAMELLNHFNFSFVVPAYNHQLWFSKLRSDSAKVASTSRTTRLDA